MNRTITAMFDTREDAEAGRQRLIAANVHTDNVRIHEQSGQTVGQADYAGAQAGGDYQPGGESRSAGEYRDETRSGELDGNRGSSHGGLWGSIKNAMLPDDDRATYEEGVRRGSFVLSADVDDDDVDNAIRALEETNCVDVEDRSRTWRNEGWTGSAAGVGAGAIGADWNRDGREATGERAIGTETGLGGTDRSDLGRSETGDTQRLNVVEERLVVGKRETERGGVRVRSYVTEQPVHEQVRLREEHVNVERRPVDQRLEGNATDAFQDRTIELTERNEEAVVGKEARVVEEVVISKSAGERTQEIDDTVRRTDVDVEQIGGTERVGGTTGYSDGRTGDGRSGETLGEKARDVVDDVKGGLGMGNRTDR